jgi:hypothetical protein
MNGSSIWNELLSATIDYKLALDGRAEEISTEEV